MKKVISNGGARSGMGMVTAKMLLSKGHTMHVFAIRLDQKGDLALAGGKTMQVDITKEMDIQFVVGVFVHKKGRVDV